MSNLKVIVIAKKTLRFNKDIALGELRKNVPCNKRQLHDVIVFT